MNLKHLQYMITLEEEGSTKKAAERLGVSQSALSKHLLVLEESLGVSLFVRAQKKLTPTAYGRIYLDAARQILQVYQFTSQTITSLSAREKTDFYLGVPPHRDLKLIVRLLPEFQKSFPNVTLHILEDYAENLILQFRGGPLQLAILNAIDIPEDDIHTFPLGIEEIVLAVPAMNPLAGLKGPGGPLSLDIGRLKNVPLILPHGSTAVRTILNSIFATKKISPNIVCEVNNSDALLTMVKQGVGCAFIPKSYQDEDTKAVYFSLSPRCFINKHFAIPKGHLLSPVEEWFINAVKKHYQTDWEYRFVFETPENAGMKEG